MSNVSISAVKSTESYSWYSYTGPTRRLTNTNGKRTVTFSQKSRFGLRESSNGKSIRMITDELGPSIVFTIDPVLKEKLLKYSSTAKASKVVISDTLKEEYANVDSWITFSKIVKNWAESILKDLTANASKGVFSSTKGKAFVKEFKSYEKKLGAAGQAEGKKQEKLIGTLSKLFAKPLKVPAPSKFKSTTESMMAKKAVSTALKLANKGLKHYYSKNMGIDHDIYLLNLSDALDHILVAAYLNEGMLKKAESYRSSLDTGSREEFEGKVFDYLQREVYKDPDYKNQY